MTSPDARTDRAASPEAAVRLTSYELMALFHVATTPGSRRTREAMRLPEIDADSPLLGAALSSLVLRGLAVDEDDRLVPAGTLVGLANVLLTASRVVEVVTTTERARQGVVVVASEHGNALLEARPTRIWQAVPLDPAAPVLDTAAGYVAASFRTQSDRPFGGVVTVIEGDGTQRSAAVRVDADGSWSLVRATAGGIGEPAAATPDPSFRLLTDALS